MPTPAQVLETRARAWREMRQVLDTFLAQALVAGVDYGTIKMKNEGTNKEYESKPCLFKPGAEKICGLFGWTARFYRDRATLDMLSEGRNDVIAYVCRLVNAAGAVIGEGRGATDLVNERRFKGNVNQAIKMAQKRAMVDAVLRAAEISERFTQDLEDMAQEERARGTTAESPAPEARPAQYPNHKERDQLAANVELLRQYLRIQSAAFGHFCVQEFGKIASQMDTAELRRLQERMWARIEKAHPTWSWEDLAKAVQGLEPVG